TVTVLVAVPLAALLAFGFVLATDVKHLVLGVHDANGTAASRRLVAELAAGGTFDPRPSPTRDALAHALVGGEIGVGIVIPTAFDRKLGEAEAGGAPPAVQVLYDGGEAVLAENAEGFLRSLVAATGAGLTRGGGGGGTGVGVVTRALFNPRLDGRPFMV